MTVARHSKWAHIVFRRYNSRILRRGFGAFHVLGQSPVTDPQLPVLLVPNHSTWWDGFFVYELNRLLLQRRFHVMMLESQLVRYPFFSRVGAFGIEPGSRREVATSLDYAATVLGDPGNLLCMFPQGELRPNGVRPLGFQRGLELILKRLSAPVTMIPVGMRAELLAGQKPDVFFSFGRSQVVDSSTFPGIVWLEAEVTRLLDQIVCAASRGESGTVLGQGRPGIQQRWDTLRGR